MPGKHNLLGGGNKDFTEHLKVKVKVNVHLYSALP